MNSQMQVSILSGLSGTAGSHVTLGNKVAHQHGRNMFFSLFCFSVSTFLGKKILLCDFFFLFQSLFAFTSCVFSFTNYFYEVRFNCRTVVVLFKIDRFSKFTPCVGLCVGCAGLHRLWIRWHQPLPNWNCGFSASYWSCCLRQKLGNFQLSRFNTFVS